jgi:predicted GTPase
MIKGIKENQTYVNFGQIKILAAPLSEAERLLLISFGYEMSATDGEIDVREQGYLQLVANQLEIDNRYQTVLETVFNSKKNFDPTVLEKVKSLLDPARFHELDTVFVNAANELLLSLPSPAKQLPKEQVANQKQVTGTYQDLLNYKVNRQKINAVCYQVYQIIQDCHQQGFLPELFAEDLLKIYEKLQSESLRVAVLGEFSQGKSTLMNTLLGEKIQPVRAIPCSGTITIVKYGKEKKILCRYKDGREEEITFEEYQDKAAIPREAARDGRNDALSNSDIEEIIFYHPEIELCLNGVEIVDSPGLNEHPERTAITQKLLKNTDAVVFLGNASRPLTNWEKDYLSELKIQLAGDKTDHGAENIFVVVNFIDLLEEEEDKQDVKQRFQSFLQTENPIIKGENRLHFISAKSALKAILDGTDNEYLQSFKQFTNSLATFLAFECGSIKIKNYANQLQTLIKAGLDNLEQTQKILDGEIQISDVEMQQILENIGEASGRDFKIRKLANSLREEVKEPLTESWQRWFDGLENRLKQKNEKWTSEYSPVWNRDLLAKDFADKFNEDLVAELDNWINTDVKAVIVKPYLEQLDSVIEQEISAIQAEIQNFNGVVNVPTSNWVFFKEVDYSANADEYFWGGLGFAGVAVALIPVIILAGPVLTIIASASAAIMGGVGGSMMLSGVVKIIKGKVFEFGYKQFLKSKDNIFDEIITKIDSTFDERVEVASKMITKIILLYEQILDSREKAYQESLEERNRKVTFIAQKRQEIEQAQNNLKAIL